METITASEALALLSRSPAGGIDVRAPIEYAKAGIEGFANLPILDDEERAAVGTCYRERGQAAAIELGLAVTNDRRTVQVAGWRAVARSSPHGFALVTCWRGGLRSRFASDWLRREGVPVRRVIGGYQAMRRHLLRAFETMPPLVVLSGLTGSGKTELLRAAAGDCPELAALDLEGLARHRGSAFGAAIGGEPQPRQAWFENSLALALVRWRLDQPRLIEDESPRIGTVMLPAAFVAAKELAPRVVVEEPIERRVKRIIDEYVAHPLAAGIDVTVVTASLLRSLSCLRRSLGAELTQQIEAALHSAFATGELAAHGEWVALLLNRYYDRTYRHALERHPRAVLFRGDWEACRQWLVGEAGAGWPSLPK